MPKRRQLTRRVVYRRKTRNPPQGNELKAPLGELVVTGRRQMAARADCGRTPARSYGRFDAPFVGAEVGVLVHKTPETMAAVKNRDQFHGGSRGREALRVR